MKHWQETREIFERIGALAAGGETAAVATVVQIAGSAYRRPGARFLITASGDTLGGVSGGCLEEDVRQTGLRVIETGESRLLHYETGDDDDALWGLGLGCNGEVDIFVQSTAAEGFGNAADALRERLEGDAPFAAVTLIESLGDTPAAGLVHVAGASNETSVDNTRDPASATGEAAPGAADAAAALEAGAAAVLEADAAAAGLEAGASTLTTIGDARAFVELFRPPSRLLICGAGDDAIPLVRLAASVGFRVAVIDHRPAYLDASRFPDAHRLVRALPGDDVALSLDDDSFIVLKTHNLARDKEWARRFVDSPAPYIGLLGPRARCDEIAETAPEAQRHRFYGPVGLDLGAEGPEQVGLAIVAELVAVRAQREAGHLRARKDAIHV